MNLANYRGTFQGALNENKYSRIAIAALAIVVALLVYGLINKSTTVVLVPPTLMEKGEVGEDRASKEVQVAWGMFITQLLGNVTPNTAPHLKELVARHLSSNLYNEMVENIDLQVKEVIEEQVTLSFAPTVARYDAESNKVIITGTLIIRGLRGQEKREQRSYELGFVTTNYNVVLDTWRVMPGAYEPEKGKTQE